MPNPDALEAAEPLDANYKIQSGDHHLYLPVHVLKVEVENNMTKMELPISTHVCKNLHQFGGVPRGLSQCALWDGKVFHCPHNCFCALLSAS